jgi:hypothetical protein
LNKKRFQAFTARHVPNGDFSSVSEGWEIIQKKDGRQNHPSWCNFAGQAPVGGAAVRLGPEYGWGQSKNCEKVISALAPAALQFLL